MSQLLKLIGVISTLLTLSATTVRAAEAEHLDTCLEVAAADYSEALSAATRLLNRDTGRCARLSSIEVKQACSNQAFEAFEQSKDQAQAIYRASVAACTR